MIRQLTVDDTNHASNFNEINNKLLENTLEIGTVRGYISTVSASNNDANNATQNGKYRVYLGVNCPKPNEHYVIEVINYTNTYIVQLATCVYSGNSNGVGKMYRRLYRNSAWETWKELAFVEVVQSGATTNAEDTDKENNGDKDKEDLRTK